jgi:ribosome-associated protein
MSFNVKSLHAELNFQTARSGGKGGQNVNKVETKVELRFDVVNSSILSEEGKQIILDRLSSKISTDGILILNHQTERSQLANKEKVVAKFEKLIMACFEVKKVRKATKPTAEMIEKRLKTKRLSGEKKEMRKKIKF